MYALNDKLKALQPYAPGDSSGMVRLDANESFLSPPRELLARAGERLAELELNRYPDPAAAALCRAFGRRYGVPAENVVAGNGSDELISLLFLAFLQKGEAYATLEPDFSMYSFNGFLNEARHVSISKREYQVDVDETVAVCNREKVRLLIFSNPCNPSSVVLPREELRRLIAGVNALVVLDEAYMDFSDQSLLGEFDRFDNLLILRTCSKAVGLAALRLGFAVGPRVLTDALRAAKSPYNVNALSQAVGTLLLEENGLLDQALETILNSRDALLRGLEGLDRAHPGRFRLLPCATNFAALVMPDAREAHRFLWESGVAVRLTGGLLRITCGKPEENQALLRAFADYLKQK